MIPAFSAKTVVVFSTGCGNSDKKSTMPNEIIGNIY
jgi:hypothetical protein